MKIIQWIVEKMVFKLASGLISRSANRLTEGKRIALLSVIDEFEEAE